MTATRRSSLALWCGLALLGAIGCSEPAPPAPLPVVLESHIAEANGQRRLILSVQEPVSVAAVAALVEAQRDTFLHVQVFTYWPPNQPRSGAPEARWDWVVGDREPRRTQVDTRHGMVGGPTP